MTIHVTAHNRCEPAERFVESFDYDETIPNWTRVQESDVGDRRIIRCARCDQPAIVVDAHWPWMTDGTRCVEHQDFQRFPLDDA